MGQEAAAFQSLAQSPVFPPICLVVLSHTQPQLSFLFLGIQDTVILTFNPDKVNSFGVFGPKWDIYCTPQRLREHHRRRKEKAQKLGNSVFWTWQAHCSLLNCCWTLLADIVNDMSALHSWWRLVYRCLLLYYFHLPLLSE